MTKNNSLKQMIGTMLPANELLFEVAFVTQLTTLLSMLPSLATRCTTWLFHQSLLILSQATNAMVKPKNSLNKNTPNVE
jgi:hypothetical protein